MTSERILGKKSVEALLFMEKISKIVLNIAAVLRLPRQS